jgi:hypothetical protein
VTVAACGPSPGPSTRPAGSLPHPGLASRLRPVRRRLVEQPQPSRTRSWATSSRPTSRRCRRPSATRRPSRCWARRSSSSVTVTVGAARRPSHHPGAPRRPAPRPAPGPPPGAFEPGPPRGPRNRVDQLPQPVQGGPHLRRNLVSRRGRVADRRLPSRTAVAAAWSLPPVTGLRPAHSASAGTGREATGRACHGGWAGRTPGHRPPAQASAADGAVPTDGVASGQPVSSALRRQISQTSPWCGGNANASRGRSGTPSPHSVTSASGRRACASQDKPSRTVSSNGPRPPVVGGPGARGSTGETRRGGRLGVDRAHRRPREGASLGFPPNVGSSAFRLSPCPAPTSPCARCGPPSTPGRGRGVGGTAGRARRPGPPRPAGPAAGSSYRPGGLARPGGDPAGHRARVDGDLRGGADQVQAARGEEQIVPADGGRIARRRPRAEASAP